MNLRLPDVRLPEWLAPLFNARSRIAARARSLPPAGLATAVIGTMSAYLLLLSVVAAVAGPLTDRTIFCGGLALMACAGGLWAWEGRRR